MNTTTRLDDQLTGFLASIAIACVVGMSFFGTPQTTAPSATLAAMTATVVAPV